MSRRYPRAPRFGVGAVVLRDDAVLLVRRGRPPHRGRWVLPGGLVELGEGIEEALVREVLEETGWRVAVGPLLDLFDFIERDDTGRVRYHYILADFLCEYRGGRLRAGSDAAEARLVRFAELERYALSDKAVEILRRARRRRPRRL